MLEPRRQAAQPARLPTFGSPAQAKQSPPRPAKGWTVTAAPSGVSAAGGVARKDRRCILGLPFAVAMDFNALSGEGQQRLPKKKRTLIEVLVRT